MELLLLLTLLISQNGFSESLEDFYQSALENTATVRDKKINVQIAEEQKNQTVGQVLPEVSAVSSSVWRDQANVGAFGEPYQHSAFLNLKQPVFQGGSEYYAIGIAKNLPRIAKLQKDQEQLVLYHNVAQAYYDLLRLHKDRQTIEEQKDLLNKRIKTLEGRFKIGRNKKTDVLASQSQLARTLADIAQVERNYQAAKMRLFNLTGKSANTANLTDSLDLDQLNIPPSWDENLTRVPVIAATKIELENAQKAIAVARGRFLPSVDLDANYYVDRAGILRDSQWDIGVVATWNFYSGGKDASEKRVATLQLQQIELRYNDLKRNLDNEYASLKQQFLLQKDMLKRLQRALNLEKQSYQQFIKEANQGLVSQLEVLRALENRIQLQRSYDEEFYKAKVSWIRIRSLAGILP